MSVLKYYKNIPRSPPHRATGPKCNFFYKFATRSLEKRGGMSSPQRATGGPVAPPLGRPMGPTHGGGRGACRPPLGRPG